MNFVVEEIKNVYINVYIEESIKNAKERIANIIFEYKKQSFVLIIKKKERWKPVVLYHYSEESVRENSKNKTCPFCKKKCVTSSICSADGDEWMQRLCNYVGCLGDVRIELLFG